MSTVQDTTPPPTLPEKPRQSWWKANRTNGAHPAGDHNAAPGTAQGYTEQGFANQQQQGRRGFATGFSFVRWVRLHVLDLITMAAMGAVGLGVYEADPAPSRSFPVL